MGELTLSGRVGQKQDRDQLDCLPRAVAEIQSADYPQCCSSGTEGQSGSEDCSLEVVFGQRFRSETQSQKYHFNWRK